MEDISKILNEAKECLNCKKPMCKDGCPVYTSIPEFISKIKEEKFEEAYKILIENNIMSEICSLVCPTENQCMGKCIKGIKGKSVDISKLELFINKWAKENNVNFNIEPKQSKKVKIAIIGAGPAGIACAVELKKEGYQVTIFEKENKVGGILEYQIPDFRLEKEIIIPIKETLTTLGINIEYNVTFGKDIDIKNLKKNGYNNVFLATGAGRSSTYELAKQENKNIFVAKDILKKYYNKEKIENLGQTIIIGGGNVAMDAARVAKKMGATKVTVIYRRNKDKMPAIKSEIEDAIEEGVEFIYDTKVIAAKTDNKNNLTNIECIKTKTLDNKIEDIEKSNFLIPANTIIFAIGLKIEEEFFNKIGIETENGLVKIDKHGMTNIPGIFAGGDLVEKNQTVCKAIASGKRAAKGIERYLRNSEK